MICFIMQLITIALLLAIGAILGLFVAALSVAAKTRDQIGGLAEYMLENPPRWVMENNLAEEWVKLSTVQQQYLNESHRLALETDKESLDSFIQSIREYYGR